MASAQSTGGRGVPQKVGCIDPPIPREWVARLRSVAAADGLSLQRTVADVV